MPRKTTPEQDDPEQSKRFIDTAREIGADETDEGADKTFKKVAPSAAPRKSSKPGTP